MGGGFLLLLLNLLLVQKTLKAQVPIPQCSPFQFEVCKVLPDINSYPPNPNNPGAFQAIYKIKLKVLPNNPNQMNLPATWNFNYLSFSGLVAVNGFTSRINLEKTELFSKGTIGSPNPYYQYLTVTESGEVTWIVGTNQSCNGGELGETLTFPDASEVLLFTIVVDGVPGDIIDFTNLSAEIRDCKTYNCPVGTMAVNQCQGQSNYLMEFLNPAICNPAKTVSFELLYAFGNTYIEIKLNNLIPGVLHESDFIVHIVPQMNGINNLEIKFDPILGGPQLHHSKRKNADGSFDFYIDPLPFTTASTTGTATILLLRVDGQFNLSQGVTFGCSMTLGRIAFTQGGGSANYTICSLSSTNATLTIPGYAACANTLKVLPTRYLGQDCNTGVRYTLTHDASGPLNLSSLKLFFAFDLSSTSMPGALTSTLPCSSCGTLIHNPTSGFWEYKYEQNTPLSLASGAEVLIPFAVNSNCVRYYVVQAEATVAGSTCALGVTFDPAQWPACDPKVRAKVVVDKNSTLLPAPFYKVTLESLSDPAYHPVNDVGCEDEFSFCPDQSKAPFQLRAEAVVPNYLCGVTTYDLVLITKHILGISPLLGAKNWIAADAVLSSPSAISTFDVSEIRKCILGIYSDFGPNGAPSWWYFNDGYSFNSPNPLFPPYAGSNILPVPPNGSVSPEVFFAVKVGDVNQTCVCGVQRPSAALEADPFFKAKRLQKRGATEEIEVPVWSNAPFDLIAAQAGFQFDPALYTLKDIVLNHELPEINEVNFGRTQQQDGKVYFAWYPLDGQTPLPKNKLLFTLIFEPKNQAARNPGPICWTSNDVLENLVYKEDGTEFNVKLEWDEAEATRNVELNFEFAPNPFQENLTGYVFSEKSGKATLSLSDSKGYSYLQNPIDLKSGENVFEINRISTLQPGVYFLTLQFEGQKIQKRVVKLMR